MGFWIVTGNFHKRVDLSEELVDRFHEGIKRKLVKDNTGNDSFTITQNEAKTLVVIHRENNTLEGIIALTGGTVFAPRKDKNIGDNVPGDMNVGDNVPGDTNVGDNVPGVRLPWREDQDWENWDAKDDFWKKVDDIDKFFGRYPYVSLIKIIPEAAIPEDSYDFFEQGGSNHLIKDIERVAKGVQAASEDSSSRASKSTKGKNISGSVEAQEKNGESVSKSANEDINSRAKSWILTWGTMLRGEEKKACDWLQQSLTNHNGKGWNKIAAKEIEDAKKNGKVPKNAKGQPHTVRSLGRNIKNAADGLLEKIKGGYVPDINN